MKNDSSGYTHEQLAALREAIASGERVVQFNGRRIEYRSLDEMRQIEERMERALNSLPCRRRHRAIFSKGL